MDQSCSTTLEARTRLFRHFAVRVPHFDPLFHLFQHPTGTFKVLSYVVRTVRQSIAREQNDARPIVQPHWSGRTTSTTSTTSRTR